MLAGCLLMIGALGIAGCQPRSVPGSKTPRPVFASVIDAKEQRVHIVTLPSGKVVKVNRVETLRFASAATLPALSLTYETLIPGARTDALQQEVRDIWEHFGPEVAEAGFSRAFVFAEQPGPGTGPPGRSFGVVFNREASGLWRSTPGAQEPCPDTLEYTGRYRNDQFGFALTIPAGLKGYWNSARCADDPADGCVCMGDHGRYVPLGPNASIEAYAGPDMLWDEQAQSVDSLRTHKGVTRVRVVRSTSGDLGRLHGKRFVIEYRQDDETRIEETIVAVDDGVQFLLTLRTGEARYVETAVVFEHVLSTWAQVRRSR